MRATYVALAVATIMLGLVADRFASGLDPVACDVLGDALWAAMMVWLVSAIMPNARLVARMAAAFAICVAVELSQLVHAPVIDAVRQTTIGAPRARQRVRSSRLRVLCARRLGRSLARVGGV